MSYPARGGRRVRLSPEILEDRTAPAVHTWTDGGATNNWSDAGNWAGGVPTTGEPNGTVVVFKTVDPSTVQNIAGLVIDQLRFDAGADVTLTLNANLGVSGSVLFQAVIDATGKNSIVGAGNLVVQGSPVVFNTKSATGQLTTGNTYTGKTLIYEGTLLLNTSTANAGLSSDIVVGNGFGAADSAVLQLGPNSFEIPDGATLTINPDGRVNVPAGTTEDLTTLHVNGGQLNIAAGGTFEIQPSGTVASDGTTGSVIDGTGNFRLGGGTVTFDVAHGAGLTDLLVAARITQLATAGLTKTGVGRLQLAAGGGGNTYTGTTTIADGALALNMTTANHGLSATIVVGDGSGGFNSAVLWLYGDSHEIPDAATMTINTDGGVMVGPGTVEGLTTLRMNGGRLFIDAAGIFEIEPNGSVTANGALTANIGGGGNLRLAGGTVTFDVADGPATVDLWVSAEISQAAWGTGLTKKGAGTLWLSGNNTYAGPTTVNAGPLQVYGVQGGSPVVVNGGTLGGNGTVGPITATGGTVAPGPPGDPVPVVLRSKSVALAGATFAPLISGTSGGTAYQLAVTGTVNLSGATLAPKRGGAAPAIGQSFVVISNDGTDPVVGTFLGLPEGAAVTVKGQQFRVSYTGGDGNDVSLTPVAVNLAVSGRTDGTAQLFAPGSAGQYATTPAATLTPFAGSTVCVRTAVGDVNGDGIPDTVLVTGPGTAIRVAVVSGLDHSTVLVQPFDPFGGDFTGGGFVTAAHLDEDGRCEFVVTPDQGGGPRTSVFSLGADGSVQQRASFFGIDDPSFRGGCRAALGDVNHDGTPDLAVCAGYLGGPRTALFDGKTVLGGTPTRLVGDFFAFPGSDAVTLRNGVFVAIGDVNGDGFDDLVFGGGPGGAPRVFVLSGALVSTGEVAGAQASPVANFFVAGNVLDRGGVRVAAKDADGDGRADVVAGSGEGSRSNVRVYLGKAFVLGGEPLEFQDLDPFAKASLPGGVFVG